MSVIIETTKISISINIYLYNNQDFKRKAANRSQKKIRPGKRKSLCAFKMLVFYQNSNLFANKWH